MKEVKIAMAGLAHGHGTGFLRAALKHEGVSIVGFFDNDNRANAEAASAEFGAPVYDSLDELLASGANTLLTARINCDKPRFIISALEAGLGVIADKPMATRMSDLLSIEAAAKKSGAPLYLMLTERYGDAVNTAKNIIDRGEIGRVVEQYLVRPHRLKPEGRPDWMFDRERYGGIINDIGVHDIDLAMYFTGSRVNRILASHVALSRFTQFTDFCDNGMTMFTLTDGGCATVNVNWLTPDAYKAHGDTRFFITGTNGYIDISTVENTVRVCTDERPVCFAELEPCARSCEEDALAKMADWSYPALISTADGIEATRWSLLAQAKAEETGKFQA